jgi:hypothetical protein
MAAGAVIAAGAAQVQNAQKMSGVFVSITPEAFAHILGKSENLLVIETKTGIFTTKWMYLLSYKGFVMYCKTSQQMGIPSRHEKIYSSSVQLPGI